MDNSSRHFIKLSVNQNAVNSEIFKKQIWLYKYDWLFKTFGIDVCTFSNIQRKKVSIFIPPAFIKLLWCIVFYVSLAKLYASFHNSFEDLKRSLSFASMLMCAFLIWYYIFHSQLKLIKSIDKLLKIADILKLASSRQFEKVCLLFFVLMYTLRICTQIHGTDKTQSKEFIRELSFGALDIHGIDWRIAMGIWHSFQLIQNHLVYAVPDFVCMFFISIGRQMTLLLNKYIIKSKNILKRGYTTSKEYDSSYQYYNAIISTFNNINEIWSIPILLIHIYYSAFIFFEILLILRDGLGPILILNTLANFIWFTAFIMVASSVNEADKIAKKINFDILCLLGPDECSHINVSVEMYSQMCHEQAFAFSGCSFFDFTRDFYLTAIGCIITYSCLITGIGE